MMGRYFLAIAILISAWNSNKIRIKKHVFYFVSEATACTLAVGSCSGLAELVTDSLLGSHCKQNKVSIL